jgi:hypothetical protein
MAEPKKKKTIHIGYVIALIVPILVIILVVVLLPSGNGGGNATPTAVVTATPQATITPTPTIPPVGSVTVSIDAPDTVDKSDSRYFHAFVKITSVNNFSAAMYDISYDPDVIRVQSVKTGDISGVTIRLATQVYVPANTQGLLRIVNSIPDAEYATGGVSGEGYLADIYFKVMGDPGDSSVISFVEGAGDPEGDLMIGNNEVIEIPATWTNSSVVIE